MKTGYKGEQPFDVWLEHWQRNQCELLTRIPAKNADDPMKNLPAAARIVMDLLIDRPDINLADLKDEAKYVCNRKNLAYDSRLISEALDTAMRSRRLL